MIFITIGTVRIFLLGTISIYIYIYLQSRKFDLNLIIILKDGQINNIENLEIHCAFFKYISLGRYLPNFHVLRLKFLVFYLGIAK